MTAFDYGNARLRAMKSRLLDRGQLERLAEARDIPALVAGLTETPYRTAIEAAMARLSGTQIVFGALLLDFRETVARIRRFYPDGAAGALRIILRRYDIHNLKAVMRGLSRRAAPEAIAEAWLPSGELEEPVLRDLAQTGDLRKALDRMATLRLPFSAPLLALRSAQPGAGLFELELALTRWYQRTTRSEAGQTGSAAAVLTEDLDWQADVEDLLAVMRFARGSRADGSPATAMGDLRAILLGHGRLSPRTLAEAAAQENIEGAVRMLQGTPYGKALSDGYQRYRVSNRLSDIEIELRRAYRERAAAQARVDPLGVGVPLGYLALKTNEIAALRWITRGVGSDLPAAEIKLGIP